MNSQRIQHGESERVLLDAFRNVVRYFMRKTKRDVEQFGVSEVFFTQEALAESFRSPMNAELFVERELQRSLAGLLAAVRRGRVVFQFLWATPDVPEPYVAALELELVRRALLKIRLLWLALPEQIPVSPRIGVINGLEPLKEAVFETLRVHEDGRLEAHQPPS